MLKLTMPIYWQQSKRKVVLVSMNSYRNWDYHTSNNFKREFSELVTDQVKGVVIPSPYILRVDLYYKNAACDGANVVPVIEKVVLDALQGCGVTTSDTVRHHLGTAWEVVGQDKENPRCEITIEHTKE